jgi:hypothetical protein
MEEIHNMKMLLFKTLREEIPPNSLIVIIA